MISHILPIALLTLKEGLRQRILYGIFIFAVLFMIFTLLVSGMFMRDIQKIILDLSLSSLNAIGLLVPFFLTINMLSRDIEQKTTYTILSRPISRSQYILGKFMGASLLTLLILGVLSVFTFVTIFSAKFIYPESFFTQLRIVPILFSCLSAYLSTMLLTSCAFLWCCVTTSSFLATLLSIATYIIGRTSEDLVRFMTMEMSDNAFSPITQVSVKLALYLFPNLASLDFKYHAAYGLAIPVQEAALAILYALAYCAVMLSLAVMLFSKRDLA